MVQNVVTYSAKSGCSLCETPGTKFYFGKNIAKQIYPYEEEDPAPLRSGPKMDQDAENASASHPINDVKGSSILSDIPLADRASSIVLDYLHLLLLGCTRYFFTLWFTQPTKQCKYLKARRITPQRKGKPDWYVGHRAKGISKFLSGIKRTTEIGRMPKSVSHWKDYKGKDWRSWLLFASLPALEKYLDDKYFQHWMLLVMSAFILPKVSQKQNLIVLTLF